MNKNELIAKVASDAQLTKGEAGEAIEATLENIQMALRGGDEVRLVGFGTFSVTSRAGNVTGHAGQHSDTLHAIRDVSVTGILNKPFDPGVLLDRLKELAA